MPKTKKNQKIAFLILKLILFGVVIGILFRQLNSVDEDMIESLDFKTPISLVAAICLVVLNIGLAYWKWKMVTTTIAFTLERKERMQSFFAGLITGLLTPNMIGNFIGRFYYYPKEHRVEVTALTMLSNYGQFLASITFGLVSVLIIQGFFIEEMNTLFWMILLVIGVFVAWLIYFFIERFARHITYFKKFEVLDQNKFHKYSRLRVQLLSVSLMRFLVFTTQYALVLNCFGQELSIQLILAIWQVYLITMLVPSLLLGKLGVKELIGVSVLSVIGVNELIVVISSLSIWLMNTIFPAMVGFVVSKKSKV